MHKEFKGPFLSPQEGWADVLAKLQIQKLPDGSMPVREIVLFIEDALVFHLGWLPARVSKAVQLLALLLQGLLELRMLSLCGTHLLLAATQPVLRVPGAELASHRAGWILCGTGCASLLC